MKKELIFALMLFMACMSCHKNFLELKDPNSVSADSYFKSENDVALAVNGVYQSLRSANCIGENSGLFTDERSDDAGRNDNQSNSGEPFQFNNFSLLPSNTYLKSHWLALYETITRCNYVLSGLPMVSITDESVKEQYAGEVKFIRAYIYFQLVREWGDVPLVTQPLHTTDDVKKNTFRAKQDSVYSQIVSDLKDAISSPLPDLQPLSGKGRVSKAAANAVLGKVFLTMAATLDPANRRTYLTQAETYLTAVYNMKTFNSLKDISYESIFDVNDKFTNPEIILQIVYKQGDPNYSSSIAANNQAKGETVNSLKPSSGSGGRATLDLVKEYEINDVRKDFSVKFANDPTVQDWFITKYRDNSPAAGVNGYGGNDWILLRYADVILMLAEVNMYLGDNTSAIRYLDMVRERAKLPSYEIASKEPGYSGKFSTLKLAILHERRVELAFEHQRWFDLLRFFTTDELVDYFHTKKQSDYGTALLSNFSEKDRYYPIPFDEYKLDPNKMYQNPGY